MDNLDRILFISFFTAAVIGAMLFFHVIGLLYLWLRDRYFLNRVGPYPWWWKVK